MKRRLLTILSVLICALLIVAFAITLIALTSSKYICINSSDVDESQFEELADNASKITFIDDTERDKLLHKTVKRDVPSFNEPFTIEITNWDMVMYDGKETLVYTISVSDADGFTTMFSVLIQERWG